MLAAERRDLLVARLRHDGRLVAREMAEELNIPEHVLRRDLRDLAVAGLCQWVYGGALLPTTITSDFAHVLGQSRRTSAASPLGPLRARLSTRPSLSWSGAASSVWPKPGPSGSSAQRIPALI